MNRQFPFWQAPYFAFFSDSFYQDVARRWRGLGFTYLFVLVLVAWVPSLLILNGLVREFRQDTLPALLEQVPEVVYENGEVSTNAEMPFYIRAQDETIAVIDTNATIEDFESFDTPVLLTRTALVFEGEDSQIEVFDLAGASWLGKVTVNQTTLQNLYDGVGKWLSIWILPWLAVGSFIYRAFQALIFAVLGIIIANTINVRLEYPALVRLSVIALTPVILVRTFFNIVGITLPIWWFLAFGLFLAYLFMAIRANSSGEPVDDATLASS